MTLDIEPKVLEDMIATLVKVTGDDVQDGMDKLAKLVIENEGNAIMEKFSGNCKKMQDSYNTYFVPAVSTLLQEYEKTSELKSIIDRVAANMSETKQGSTDITADPIQLPEV